MRKIIICILSLFMAFPAFAQMCNIVDGFQQCYIDIIHGQGIFPAPDESQSGMGTIYYDYADDKWKCSENGGAYVDFCAAGGGGYTNLTSFVDQTAWRVFYSNGSGDVTELALGSSGTVLQSNGASSAPTWATVASTDDSCWEDNGSGGITPVTASCSDTLWEDNGSGGIMPKL